MNNKCPVCGYGFFLVSGHCDHCDSHEDSQNVSIATHAHDNHSKRGLIGRSILAAVIRLARRLQEL